MWFDGIRQPNTIYVASVSRGKDSTAMLRAIQILGFPLDAICAVDIWFDQDTPAELPPMVRFKDEWDKKCLETFGVPVTRVCAQKRERERDSLIPTSSTEKECGAEDMASSTTSTREQSQSTDSRSDAERGATQDLKSNRKLTYCDIFYKKISHKRERERENAHGTPIIRREETVRLSDSHCNGGTGAMDNSRCVWIPNSERQLVYGTQNNRRTQYGFPTRLAPWCQSKLKGTILDNPFQTSPGTRGRK